LSPRKRMGQQEDAMSPVPLYRFPHLLSIPQHLFAPLTQGVYNLQVQRRQAHNGVEGA